MNEPLGEDQVHARGSKAGGDPGPPPSAKESTTIHRAKGSKDPGDPAPPPLVIGAAGIAFLAGAHALAAYLGECLTGLNLALTAAEIAALVTLIVWIVNLYARGSKDPGDPAPPPLATAPANVAAALLVLAGAAQIGAALLGECLQGMFAVLGIAELVLAGIILQASKPTPGAQQSAE
ncbi:MAG: hypothetical protein AAF604_04270 [Acidobacteriota bacterium]